jgi:RNase P/RNase MRP subunit p30
VRSLRAAPRLRCELRVLCEPPCQLTPAAVAAAQSPSNGVNATYDLVAAVPQTEQLFDDCCRRLDIDLISLDLTERVPFRMSLPAVAAAIARGVHFEICYAPALRDSASRRNLVANSQQLLRLTRGRNIVLSSGALRPMELRGPHDVANLGMSLLGMAHDAAHKAVGSNLVAVLKRAQLRRGGGLKVESGATSSQTVAVRREQIPGMIQVARQNSSAEAAAKKSMAGPSRKRKLGSVAARLAAGGRKRGAQQQASGTGGQGSTEEHHGQHEQEEEEQTEEADAAAQPRSADFLAL